MKSNFRSVESPARQNEMCGFIRSMDHGRLEHEKTGRPLPLRTLPSPGSLTGGLAVAVCTPPLWSHLSRQTRFSGFRSCFWPSGRIRRLEHLPLSPRCAFCSNTERALSLHITFLRPSEDCSSPSSLAKYSQEDTQFRPLTIRSPSTPMPASLSKQVLKSSA